MSQKFRPGDNLRYQDGNVVREIVDVRETGYGWKYPDYGAITPEGGENYWWSENSGDPFFEMGWKLIEKSVQQSEMNADMKRLCEAVHKCITLDHSGMEDSDPSFAEAIVRAVLTALREPTEGMRDAGADVEIVEYGDRDFIRFERPENAGAIFSGMIDHVLAEHAITGAR